jgi:hypothetical protein
MDTTRLLDLDFAPLTAQAAAAAIAARPPGAQFAYVVTPNADHLARLAATPSLLPAYQAATLCLLDSRVIAALCRLLGLPAPPVATGADVTEALLTRHVVPGERIGIIGLSPVWLPSLMARFDLAPPAHCNPPMGFEQDPAAVQAIIRFVRAHPARLLFLAVGSPRQETLAAALAAEPGLTGTALCIGASLEYLCGAKRRAPAALRRMGLEWLWRLAHEPTRLARRYLVDSPRVIAPLLRQRRRRARPAPPALHA